jgi:hypothetical protein
MICCGYFVFLVIFAGKKLQYFLNGVPAFQKKNAAATLELLLYVKIENNKIIVFFETCGIKL